ncbi:MAG TPA: PH domain-containing protein [Candidatus Stackebrandtia excrementipullorum]|nr:PH domain-containing protein [Candidatus Stackebrandtia excrementipullorum]
MTGTGSGDEPADDTVTPTTDATATSPDDGSDLPGQPRQRLHPLSPVLHGIKTLWLIIAALSWQGFARFGLTVGGVIVLCAGVLGMFWAVLTWYYTGYQVTDGQLRIAKGVLVRSHRTIPLERLQSIELRQPLLARACGLAELRMEVVGGSGTEAPLAFLPLSQAERLRVDLLALSTSLGADINTSTERERTPDVPIEPAAVVHVTPRRLVVSQLLTPDVLIVPIAAAVTLGLFLWQPDMTFYGIAGLVTATVGILLRPVSKAMSNYDFAMRDTADGLRITRGLTERRSQTLPPSRVTAVAIRWPFMWRRLGWVNARVANAGFTGQGGEETLNGSTILPVGTPSEALRVARSALQDRDMGAVTLLPAPRRASWCSPLGRPALGVAVTEDLFVCRSGRITPQLVAVPRERIQSLRVVQGRLQRILGLATLHVDVAGGIAIPTRAEHRDASEALALARRLSRTPGGVSAGD